jgi:hypothetical protein
MRTSEDFPRKQRGKWFQCPYPGELFPFLGIKRREGLLDPEYIPRPF